MFRRLLPLVLGLIALVPSSVGGGNAAVSDPDRVTPAATKGEPGARTRVVVIPVREQVDSPLLFIIRRGLKQAIEDKADAVVLDMKTPGGALDVTFEIMEALGKFPGKTITFVNSEALSAGAFISATTEEIWFAPDGVIGAAAPVLATGQEIDATMRQKIVSYLKARIRATSEGKGGYRGQVISAMIDSDYELKIGDKVLKGKGELLSLTAKEAAEKYGDPAQALLAAGVAKDISELLDQRFGEGKYSVNTLEITWSEHFAVFLRALAPILLGVGLLALYIEFKTPGFGVFGVTGIVCLAIVFLSNYVAGLSGHEPMLLFGLGFVMVLVELIFFPGIVVLALSGLALMLGSLLWSMADIWPNEPVSVQGDMFLLPLRDLSLGLLVAVGLALALARFIPKGWFFTRLAVSQPVAGAAQVAGAAPATGLATDSLVGRSGVAMTGLFPSGQVEVDGQRFEARLEVGSAPKGTRVVVRRRTDFGLMVDRDEGRTA
ncbi:MAG: ATP-dependent Clp protease proteolytic subunit [Verrucomicrobia bacterium]|nr:ATP-dependent Clp protease proteolytic subunit [Verrucomicrobiota bacterium]